MVGEIANAIRETEHITVAELMQSLRNLRPPSGAGKLEAA
jgi:hypothetical protein